MSVLLNTTAPGATTPSFAAQQTFATGSDPRSVTAADVNGDGKPDLIVANLSANTVSVLLNTRTQSPLGSPATGTIHYSRADRDAHADQDADAHTNAYCDSHRD